MQNQINDIINKIRLVIETDINFGIEEYYPSLKLIQVPNKKNVSKLQKTKMLKELKEQVQRCEKCQLYKTRNNMVFGEGNPDAKLLFVGEAPGREEDLRARPFVGRAGKLLTKIINAMDFERSDIYIANILKDRPPNNRNPKDNEIEACKEHLFSQIDIIQPKVICTLGTFATCVLLDTNVSISRLRGNFFDYKNIKLIPTYHPAYLLRNPKDKRLVWEDMKKIIKVLKTDKNDS